MLKLRRMKGEGEVLIFLMIISSAAWLTHVITCLQDERWEFLIAGALFFPVAIVHGIGLWFGYW